MVNGKTAPCRSSYAPQVRKNYVVQIPNMHNNFKIRYGSFTYNVSQLSRTVKAVGRLGPALTVH